jgi:hypothetical protein
MVYFSAVGGEVVIDVIPMIEIAEVAAIVGEDENQEYSNESRLERKEGRLDSVSKFANSLEISTCPGGYNSGRKYVLQASSAEQCAKMIRDLAELSRIARKLAVRRSKFQKSQAKVKRVFLSNAFHIIMSFMILAVGFEELQRFSLLLHFLS